MNNIIYVWLHDGMPRRSHRVWVHDDEIVHDGDCRMVLRLTPLRAANAPMLIERYEERLHGKLEEAIS